MYRSVEAPKDKEWITADKEAAAAVTALTRHIPYVTRLKGEKAPGAPRLDPEAALDTIDENGFEGAGKFIFISTRARAIGVTTDVVIFFCSFIFYFISVRAIGL